MGSVTTKNNVVLELTHTDKSLLGSQDIECEDGIVVA